MDIFIVISMIHVLAALGFFCLMIEPLILHKPVHVTPLHILCLICSPLFLIPILFGIYLIDKMINFVCFMLKKYNKVLFTVDINKE